MRTIYTLAELKKMKTLTSGQRDDLKAESKDTRVWLSRCPVENGEPYNNKVSIETKINGKWITTGEYQAQ